MIRSLQRELKELARTRPKLRQGSVTAVNPLKVSVGGSAAVSARGVGQKLSVGDPVQVLQHGPDLLVIGSPRTDMAGSWIEIGATSAPAFTNSWANSGAGNSTAAFCKDQFGMVYLKGRITGGTSNTIAFTLPTGYRPAAFSSFGTVAGNVFGMLTVSGNGRVNPIVNTWISLDGISFRAS